MNDAVVQLEHGEGGLLTHRLIREVFEARLGKPEPIPEDSTVVPGASRIAVTTDVFVVSPYRFPGGDIGKLAIAGTYNDLVVRGATPKYVTLSFILEEGLQMRELESVVSSVAREAGRAGLAVVAGDTKVVPRGHCDGLYISASGVGFMDNHRMLGIAAVSPGDVVMVTGDIGRHGAAIMACRLGLTGNSLMSDCGSMTALRDVAGVDGVRCMRDITRGGLATVLCEISEGASVGVDVNEDSIPVRPDTAELCELAGFDVLYLPCEGTAVVIASAEASDEVLRLLRESSAHSAVIGQVTNGHEIVRFVTRYGGSRRLSQLIGAQLPRMC